MRILLLLPALVLAGCAKPVPMVEEASRAPLPEAEYGRAAREGDRVYRVLPQESLILVRVGRAGRFEALGHEHAVASEDVQGFVAVGDVPGDAKADIAFPLRNLVVDRPAYREHFGFDSQPSEDDIAGTYSNLQRVFEPERYPWVSVRAHIVSGDIGKPLLAASVVLHGATFRYELPAELEFDGDRVTASGKATIRHSDFGVEPYSAAGGLLRVADELVVEFHIVARRMQRQPLGS